MSYHVKDSATFEAICKLAPLFEPTLGQSYVAVYPSQILRDTPIRLFNISTGKMALCSWHELVRYVL